MSGPDLHVFTLKFLALKNWFFPHKKYLQLFSADPKIFSKIFQINFLSIKTLKSGPRKLLIIGPNPFISQSIPDHRPKPRIDFSYHEILGPDISSLICEYCARISHAYRGSKSNRTMKQKHLCSFEIDFFLDRASIINCLQILQYVIIFLVGQFPQTTNFIRTARFVCCQGHGPLVNSHQGCLPLFCLLGLAKRVSGQISVPSGIFKH